jgi:hypothetical protein
MQQQRKRARCDEAVQHAGQPDIPLHGRVEPIETDVDGSSRGQCHAPPIHVAEDVVEQRADDDERGEVRPKVP